ncbi:hypothetical protein WHI96_11065 [Pseudonocardia tropica]|uniref:Uncharacterized protein n=1 Tax=Pseudonocardia tropica TaxID=681289 RepID=A0ABV1JTU1_9PSEU
MRPTRAIPDRGGLTRRRRGRGFSYHDATGAAVAAPVRARIEEPVIPPAGRDVRTSERERDHDPRRRPQQPRRPAPGTAFEEGHTVAAGLRRIPCGADEHRSRVAVERAVPRLLERHT